MMNQKVSLLFYYLLIFSSSPPFFTGSNAQNFLDPNNPIVTTSHGRVRGIIQDVGEGKSALSFIGIPFAAPPIRGLRFRVSQTRIPHYANARNQKN